MENRTAVCITMLLLAGGCAGPPKSQPEYSLAEHEAQTETVIEWTAASQDADPPAASREMEAASASDETHPAAASHETAEPVTMPLEPELQGAHPVDFYVQFALQRNPEIRAAERAVAAQAETIPQVTALDDPMFGSVVWPDRDHSPQTASGRMPAGVNLSQRFPWFNKLRIRGEVAEQETQIALTRFADAQLKVIEEVHLAYYELLFNQRAIEITEQNRSLLEDLLKFAEARYRTGETSQQDVLRAQVELEKLQDRLIVLRQALEMVQADLARVLHTSPEADLRAEPPLDSPSVPDAVDQLYAAAVQCRPELQERWLAIVRDQRKVELAQLDYYPDLTTGLDYGIMTINNALSAVADGRDNVGVMFGINVPIWRQKLRAGVSEAEHRVLESARRYDATRDETFRLIKRLMVQARALEQQIALFRDGIIPKAEQTLRISAADYRVGKVDFQQIIDNWSDLLMFQIQLARLEAMLGQTLASLDRVVGCQLATLPETAPDSRHVPPPPGPPPERLGPVDDAQPAPKE